MMNEAITGELRAAELKAALEGAMPRCRVSGFYQAGLLLVAVFVILLPLAYLAFSGRPLVSADPSTLN